MTHHNSTNKKDHENHKGRNPLATGFGLAVAMAIGATLGVIFAPKSGEETQKDLIEKAEGIAKKFHKSRQQIQNTIQDIFGEVTEELEKDYLELQGNILAHIEDMKDKAELTQKEYSQIVQDTVQEFAKRKKWTEKVVQHLIKDLLKDWK